MVLYENTIANWLAAMNEKKLVPFIISEYENNFDKLDNESKLMFKYTMSEIYEALNDGFDPECGIRIDLVISNVQTRFVVILASKKDDKYNVGLINLLAYEKVRPSSKEDMIYADEGDGEMIAIHPSYQALSYKNFITRDYDDGKTSFKTFAFLFDCVYDPENDIRESYKEEYLREAPVLFADEIGIVSSYLNEVATGNNGLEALSSLHERDHIVFSSQIKQLFDDQKYIVDQVIDDLKNNRNIWYMIKGRAGTGTTVVAGRCLKEAYSLNKEIVILENDPTFSVDKLKDNGVSMMFYEELVENDLINEVIKTAEKKKIEIRQYELTINIGRSDGGRGYNFLARYLQIDNELKKEEWNPEDYLIEVVDDKDSFSNNKDYANVTIKGNISYDPENKLVLGSIKAKHKVLKLISNGLKGVYLLIEDENLKNYLRKAINDAKEKYSWLDDYLSGKEEDLIKAQGSLLNNQKLNDKISQKIITTLGENAWSRLSDESRLCLISGYLALNDMKQYSQLLDFSGACLQICKAVEVELTKRLFTEFVSFFKNKYGKEAEEKAPYDLLRYKDDKTKPKIFNDPAFVTIGNFRFFIGMASGGKIINNYAWREFSDYAKNALLIEPGSCEKTLAEHVQYITKIKDDYRNKSAHKSTLDVVQATECYNYIIGQYRRLGIMLDAYRF